MFLRQAIAKCLLELAESDAYWFGNEDQLVGYIVGKLHGGPSEREFIRQILFSPAIQRECRKLEIDFSWCEMPIGEVNSDVK